MRTFFIQLRVYRKRDQQYITLYVKALAETVTSLDQQVAAFSAGLQLVSAIVSLEAVFFDYPLGPVSADQFKEFGELVPDLYDFLLKRQRTPKGVTTEERNES